MSKQIIAVAMIAALAPTGEDFKPEAVNEGVWLTEAHLNAIEGKLAADATAATTAANDLAAANTAKKTAEDALATANQTIAANKTTIDNLTAEVAQLKQKQAGKFSATSTPEDESPVDDKQKSKADKYRTSFDAEAEKFS